MQLQYAFCANYAEAGESGTFSVIGAGINVLHVPTLPGRVRTLYVIARVTFTSEERARPHELAVDLFGPDGVRLDGWPLVAPVSPMARVDLPDLPSGATCITALTVPVFAKAGEHRFVFSAAGQVLGSTSFWVEPMSNGERAQTATAEEP